MIIERNDDLRIDIATISDEYKAFASEAQDFLAVRNVYQAAIKEISTKVNHDYNPIHHMESRVKSVKSILEKIMRRGLDGEEKAFMKISDIAGIRVICKYAEDIYRIRGMLLSQDDIKFLSEADYIKNPKESGYRSLHLLVTVPVFLSDRVEHVPVEIQIRTVVMDTWASLEHELRYKRQGTPISEEASKKLRRCAEQMQAIDDMMSDIHREL